MNGYRFGTTGEKALENKTCKKCGTTRSISQFEVINKKTGSTRGTCRECRYVAQYGPKEGKMEYNGDLSLSYIGRKGAFQRRLRRVEKNILDSIGKFVCNGCGVCDKSDKKSSRNHCKSCYKIYIKEKNYESGKRWRNENRDHLKFYMQKWSSENKEKIMANGHKRRAKFLQADGGHTSEQVKARFDFHGNKCIYCGCGGEMTLEHMIPLSRGGSNWPANLAPACKSCNSSKHNKTISEFKVYRSL